MQGAPAFATQNLKNETPAETPIAAAVGKNIAEAGATGGKQLETDEQIRNEALRLKIVSSAKEWLIATQSTLMNRGSSQWNNS